MLFTEITQLQPFRYATVFLLHMPRLRSIPTESFASMENKRCIFEQLQRFNCFNINPNSFADPLNVCAVYVHTPYMHECFIYNDANEIADIGRQRKQNTGIFKNFIP